MKDEVALPAMSDFQFALTAYRTHEGARKAQWGPIVLQNAGTDLTRLRRAHQAAEPKSNLDKSVQARICRHSDTTKKWIANFGVARKGTFLRRKTIAELMERVRTKSEWQEVVKEVRPNDAAGRYLEREEETKKLFAKGARFLHRANPKVYLDWKIIFLLAHASECADIALDAFSMMEKTATCETDRQNFAFYRKAVEEARERRVANEG